MAMTGLPSKKCSKRTSVKSRTYAQAKEKKIKTKIFFLNKTLTTHKHQAFYACRTETGKLKLLKWSKNRTNTI